MLSSKPTTTPPPPDNHPPNNRKAAVTDQTDPQQPPIKCPRCDSSNTKFCYYNNYSLSQPRHFCKTCRRYWTRGGALRNVPIGGGCRNNNNNKSKKLKTSNVIVPSSTADPAVDFGFKFLPTAPPSAGVYTHSGTHFVASGSGHGFGLDLFGSNSNPGGTNTSAGGVGVGDGNHKISISSIESLSSINQEMHWKLQQQRMALIYRGDHDHDHDHHEKEHQQQEGEEGCINLFQSMEFSGKVEVGPRDWSFGIQPTNYATNSTITATTTVNHVSNNNNCDVVHNEVETVTATAAATAEFTALQHDQHAVSVGAWTNLHHQFNNSV